MQSTASETVFLCLLAARNKIVDKIKKENPDIMEKDILPRLVGYCTDQVSFYRYYKVKFKIFKEAGWSIN